MVSIEQSRLPVAALRAAGCDFIRSEKRSGTTTSGREELQGLLEFIRKGDVLTVTRIDRLARSTRDLQDIVRGLKAKGRLAQGDRAADRHQHGSRQVLPRHAGGVRGIRDQPTSGTPARRNREGQGRWGLQGPACVDRRNQGAPDEGPGHGSVGDRQGLEDRSRLGLQSAWRAERSRRWARRPSRWWLDRMAQEFAKLPEPKVVQP